MDLHSIWDMSSTPHIDELAPSRPAKETVTEILAMSLLGITGTFVLASMPVGTNGASRVLGLAPAAGTVVLEHIGWAFGVYVPILLGFYVIVIGGQLVGDPSTAAKYRRTLGFVAEAMTAALLPALLLVLAACFADLSRLGALFVIVPVAAVTFFLTIELGRFIVFERDLRLAAAKRSQEWTKQRLRTVRHRARKPLWLVLAVHTVVAGLLGMATTLSLARLTDAMAVAKLFLLYGLIGLGLAFASVHGIHTLHTVRTRTEKVVIAWTLPVLIYLAGLLLTSEVFVSVGSPVGYSLILILLLLLTSTFWPRARAPRFFLNWTLQGGATAYAAKKLTAAYIRTTKEIRELGETPGARSQPSLRTRLVAALQAFQSSTPALPTNATGAKNTDA